MATYKQICQKAASEYGTFNGTVPTTVLSQTGRLGVLVRQVADAWTGIQNYSEDWSWMRGEYSGSTVASQARYDGSDFGVSADRFSHFLEAYPGARGVSIYDPSIGLTDEGSLHFMEWGRFYAAYVKGYHAAARPVWYSLSPDGQMVLSPTPDKAYTVRGPYHKAPQTLALDDDTPEMPARFHDLIMWWALVNFATRDESPQLALWNSQKNLLLRKLENAQLPRITLPEAGAFA